MGSQERVVPLELEIWAHKEAGERGEDPGLAAVGTENIHPQEPLRKPSSKALPI